ncbi:MAG: FAD-dependent monooxygenase, partial [Candidatus Baltobacteraceae bacterium]
MSDLPVLISGAGPSGLALALSLVHRGVPFRIIDENAGPGEHSRAMAVQARTLEFYQQFGIGDEVVNEGIVIQRAHLRTGLAAERGEHEQTVYFNEIGTGLSPYPFVLSYPQDDHERFLVAKLHALGIEVERNAKLTGLSEDGASMTATVADGDGHVETIRAAYVCGCDGAHSAVRQLLGVGFSGGTYDQMFFVADVKTAESIQPDLYGNLGSDVLVLMLPVRSSGMERLIGLVPPQLCGKADLSFEDVRSYAEPLLGVTVAEVNWFSAYHVHHRVADRFRAGRAFLLGDAGHVHSPVGGQGMNTGIGDAMNLGWKLASVVRERA